MVSGADKTVLVTGASRGIGQAMVEEALRRGAARVYAAARHPVAHPDQRVTPLTVDVSDTKQAQEAAASVESLALLIDNAGVQPLDDLSGPAALEQALAVNLFGPYRVSPAFLPALTRSRGTKGRAPHPPHGWQANDPKRRHWSGAHQHEEEGMHGVVTKLAEMGTVRLLGADALFGTDPPVRS